MATLHTETVTVTIDAPFDAVAGDLADPAAHTEWATEFFTGPATPAGNGEFVVHVPRMGGDARFKIDADVDRGLIDLYLAPGEAPFGAPLPVRVVRNGDGVDVLFTLTRYPGVGDVAWREGIASMERELAELKRRHER